MSVCPPDRLSGTTIVNPGSDPDNCELVHCPPDLNLGCPPDLAAAGGPPIGSTPVISGDLSGPFLTPATPWEPLDLAAIGPQFDLQIVNNTDCLFIIVPSYGGPGWNVVMDPGATLQSGIALGVTVDAPPVTLTPASFYASQFYRENVTGSTEVSSFGVGNLDQPFITAFAVGLAPGSFAWYSTRLLAATSGFGTSTAAATNGYSVTLLGFRV